MGDEGCSDISILCKALEKSVKMLQDHEEQLKKLNDTVSNLNHKVEVLTVRLDCLKLDVGAADDLNDFMQSAKDELAFDAPLTGAELAKRTSEYYNRKRFGGS